MKPYNSDDKVLPILFQQLKRHKKSKKFRNEVIQELARNLNQPASDIFTKLDKHGAFDFNFKREKFQDVDGTTRTVKILKASETDMWPMGTHFWLRDNAITGANLLNLRCKYKNKLSFARSTGKQLLFSCLTLMSTISQLSRFEKIIRSRSTSYLKDANNWPHIFLGIKNNLNGNQTEIWAHKQDAWQILGYYVLKGINDRKISLSELDQSHLKFLGLMIPFLIKVNFSRSPNSGSWEEIEAVRTSVIAWELALIEEIKIFCNKNLGDFFQKSFKQCRRHLGERYQNLKFENALEKMSKDGATAIYKALPHECPSYKRSDIRYRESDSALIYLLLLQTPVQVEKILNLGDKWSTKSELRILKNVLRLFDKQTGGFIRYENDSYQRVGFFRPSIVRSLTEMYGGPSGDARTNFTGRDNLVPKGREASWTHFTWQLSSWAGQRFLESGNIKYKKLQAQFLNEGLRTITGKNEYSLEQVCDDYIRVIKVKAFRFPECYLTEIDHQGNEVIFPSPHTPLNWATAEAIKAIDLWSVTQDNHC